MAVTLYGSKQAIIQVLSQTLTSQISTTSTSATATGLSISITPSSSSNKILAVFSSAVLPTSELYCHISKNGTQLTSRTHNASSWGGSCIQYLDSPATTSAVTYAVFYYVNSGTGYMGASASPAGGATLTLYEVAYA